MAVGREWSEWWRRFLGSFPEGNGNAAVDILRRRYLEEMQQIHSARSVSYSPDGQHGAYPIGDYYSDHPSHFWLHQRSLYRRAATS
jgi:hypothetical protein